MTIRVENIFADLPESSGQERFLTLLENELVRIDRIVSQSHSSPPSFWYDQDECEWVIILRGHAILEFEEASQFNERGRSRDHPNAC